MRKRPHKTEVEEIRETNERVFNLRMELAKKTNSKSFSMEELEKVLKSLKKEKSKDPDGYICELFKEGLIGSDLKLSLLMMMKNMKNENYVPACLRTAYVTILHKSRFSTTGK